MVRVVSTASDLEDAWRRHRLAANGDSDAHHLLLFYAAEVGLKALIAKKNGLANSEDVLVLVQDHADKKDRPSLGHRIDILCDCAKLDGLEKGSMPDGQFTVRNTTCAAHQIHEAWRYGAPVEPATYAQQMIAWLLHVVGVVKEKLENE